MRRALCCVFLLACVHDQYHCTSDEECDLGQGGRCEADHFCTHFDVGCPLTQRSYTDHSDALSGTCFVGEVTPLDYCASGQPPAIATGCAATVCSKLPACCTTGWSEACVLQAQMVCPIQCETAVSVAASHAGSVDVSVVRFDTNLKKWVGTPHPELGTAAVYLAPAPGSSEPRLAGFGSNSAQVLIESSIETQSVPVSAAADREYHDVVSLDLDRDLRDTLLMDYQDVSGRTQSIQVVKLDTGETRDVYTGFSQHMAWGSVRDASGVDDGYPDAVIGNANTYSVFTNDADGKQSKNRQLNMTLNTDNFDLFTTNGAGQAVHTFNWADLDGDGAFDLVAFGNSIQVHIGDIVADTTPTLDLDCDPPRPYDQCFTTGSGSNTGSAAVDQTAYYGTVFPAADGTTEILAAPFDFDYTLNKASNTPIYYAIKLVNDNGAFTFTYNTVTLPSDCPTCGIEAFVVRDFDGDGLMDILAIDINLNFFTALSTKNYLFTEQKPIAQLGTYATVRTSVTGFPR